MINIALKNGVAVTVAVLLVVIFGLVSLFRVPVQMTPDLTVTTISVLTSWPGATPQDIEKEIIIEQERYLRSLPNLSDMTATANTGSAEIELEFNVGTNLEETLVRVNNALSQVPDYPENVDQPRITTSSASDQPIAWFSVRPLPGNPKNLDIVAMQDFLEDNIQTEFERTPGVSQSEVRGGAERQLRIYVDPVRLAERRITMDELRNALRTRNRDVSGGDFDENKNRYLIRTVGRFQNEQDLLNAVIARRDGTPVYLRDVGTVEMDRAELRAQVRHNGELAVAMNARRSPGTNIIEVMDSLKATVETLNAGIMKENGMIIRQVSDDTIYIREAIALVRTNLLLGGVLATLVLLLFLRSIPATLIGSLGVPICAIGSFLGLTLAGRTINVISLAGVGFAIGMTLDNSIVVLENIYRHRAMGKSRFQAAKDGVREVWGAVLASTLTTVFVFLPIVFVQEESGQLFADIAIAISAAIIISMLVAVTVIPTAASRLLTRPPKECPEGRPRAANLFGLALVARRFSAAIMGVVGWLMKGVFRRIGLVVGMTGLSVFFVAVLTPQTEYLPDGSQNVLFAFMTPPPGYNFETMTEIGKEIEADFLPYVKTDPAAYHAGESDVPALDEFFFINTTSFLLVITKTVDPNDLDEVIPILTERLNEVPGMISFATRRSIFSGGLTGARGLELNISGRNLVDLFDVGLQGFLKTREELSQNVRPEPAPTLGQPLLEIRPDWERAAELGIDTQSLGYLVWALTDGAYVDEFFLLDDKIDMFLYSTQGTVDSTEDLENLYLYARDGSPVPLSAVADIVQTVNTETIRRVDRERTVTLSIVPPAELPLERAVEIAQTNVIDAMRADGSVPEGVSMRIAGASDKLDATRQALGGNFALAVLISYLLMVALFRHWGYPLVIMTSLPLGIVGGIVGLWLMNFGANVPFLPGVYQPLDVLTMLGFVILIGTVVNNPILIVEQALVFIREEGMAVTDAVVESTRTRIRPIMMSTTTTIFGLSPLVFMPGSGNELYRGIGTVVLFGLAFSTLFTLTFIPSVLSLFLQFGELLHRKRLEVQLRLSGSSEAIPVAADLQPDGAPAADGNGSRTEDEEEPARTN